MHGEPPAPDADTNAVSSESKLSGERPTFRADVYLLTETDYSISSHLPNSVPLQRYTDIETFRSEIGGSVAVALLSTAYAEGSLRSAIQRTIAESAHARILIVANNSADLLRYDLPYDEEVVLPQDSDEFPTLVKRLYLRAYYAAITERYYKVALEIRNRETRLPPKKCEEDDRLETLTRVRKRLKSNMQYLRRRLSSADLDAMADREQRFTALSERSKNTDPTAMGLPKACPECRLDWTKWHGKRLRDGFVSIGANTWQCTRCSSVLADNDPNNYHLG